MTATRIALGIVQTMGAVSILPYPGVLIASVMQVASGGGARRLLHLGLVVYPAVWIALWFLSWQALAQQSPGGAFLLSSLPIVFSLAGAVWYLRSEKSDRDRTQARGDAIRREVQAANPLVWTLMTTMGPDAFPYVERMPTEVAIEEIARASPFEVNGVAGYHGSPLRIALLNLNNKTNRVSREDRLRIVQALLARGAELSIEERNVPLYAQLLEQVRSRRV